MKKLIALSMAVAVAAASVAANAAVENTFVVGARAGWAHNYLDNEDYASADRKNGYGYGLYLGYNIKSWLGVEGGYNVYDGFKIKGADGAVNGDGEDISGKHDLKYRGPEVAVRFAYPLDEKGSDVFARVGAAAFTIHADDVGYAHHVDPLIGIGYQYAFTRNVAVRAGYDYYFNNSKDIHGNLGFLYVGVQMMFGGPAAAAAAPAVTTTTQRVTENHQLDAGVLFPFDGAKLSAEGRDAVATIVNGSAELQNAQYEVYGYTDRLGSDAYNQKLSQKRADAVADEMRSEGVTEIGSVEGYGKAAPVTGNKCDNVKGKKALIECLAPDRRVEIVVTGDKTVEK